jgi:hypothetical protein
MLGVISITYYYAVERVNAGSQFLKVSMAKQNMNAVDENLISTLWQPGSSRTLEFSDSGGTLNVQPFGNSLFISINDSQEIAGTIFNATVGRVIYELPYSELADTGLFLKGDSRAIINQTGSGMTQLYVQSGVEHPEILLRYRPVTSSTTSGIETNKTVNDVRVYIVNLNSSQEFGFMGKVPLKISCTNVESSIITYNLSYQPTALTITANYDGVQGQVSIPISSTANGAIINVELVVCEVKIERWVR